MSDDADMTQDRLELEEKIRRKYIHRTANEVDATGYCLNCGEDLPIDKRWCDADCQQDWQKRRR
jgi:predicted aldo/keto reductase-like oxidoreductase